MIIHFIHHPVSAKRFIEPLVRGLNAAGAQAELWLEDRQSLSTFTAAIDCPRRFAVFDLSWNPFALLVRLTRLTHRLAPLRPKAIHAHQLRASFIPLLASLLARVPVRIYHCHGAPYLGYKGILKSLLWTLEWVNCRLATHIVVVSPAIRIKMIEHRVTSETKCQVLGDGSACGIDLAEFAPEQFDAAHRLKARKVLGIAPHAYVAFYVGRPFKRKGFHDLLTVWQSLDSFQECNVLLLAGCTEDDVRKTVGKTPRSIVPLGYMSDLRPCYAACNVVVLPSRHEGFPYSLLEGAAATRPLIGTEIPGIDSIITHQENGVLVPTGDNEALLKAIVALKESPQQAERMGCSGRRRVEQCFDRNRTIRLLLEYYRRIGILVST